MSEQDWRERQLTCTHCGWQWYPRLDRQPAVCPRCKSYNYLEPVKKRQHGPAGKPGMEAERRE